MSGLVIRASAPTDWDEFPANFLYSNAARLLDHFTTPSGTSERAIRKLHSMSTSNFPKINFGIVKKGGVYTKFVMDVALAGYSTDEVEVEIDHKDRTLTLRGTPLKSAENTDPDAEQYISIEHEIKQSHFERRFTAPDRADLEKVTHKYEDGVLTIEIPILYEAPHVTKLKLK